MDKNHNYAPSKLILIIVFQMHSAIRYDLIRKLFWIVVNEQTPIKDSCWEMFFEFFLWNFIPIFLIRIQTVSSKIPEFFPFIILFYNKVSFFKKEFLYKLLQREACSFWMMTGFWQNRLTILILIVVPIKLALHIDSFKSNPCCWIFWVICKTCKQPHPV